MFAVLVYVLCAVTSLVCSVLLWRGYRRTRARLLLWSALCFAGLSLNNLFLIADVKIFTQVDLTIYRSLPALVGVMLLLYGLVWASDR